MTFFRCGTDGTSGDQLTHSGDRPPQAFLRAPFHDAVTLETVRQLSLAAVRILLLGQFAIVAAVGIVLEHAVILLTVLLVSATFMDAGESAPQHHVSRTAWSRASQDSGAF